MENLLLTRDTFREGTFARDGNKCVHCGAKDVKLDAHHIVERRLFPDGGYYLNNGVTVCEDCHILAESTVLDCETLRHDAGITEVLLPPHFQADEVVDKWGNPILSNGMRLRGELFEEPSVQKALAPVLYLFTNRVKYPRTYHLPWSPGLQNDDRMHESIEQFTGMEVVVTEKIDGENTTMYRDYLHARSLEFEAHPSRTFIKAIHASCAYDIPEGWRVCGENVTAKHSIKYFGLPSYFMVFSIWNDHNVRLSWDDITEYTALLGLNLVPVLYRGVFNIDKLHEIEANLDPERQEGYVVSPVAPFSFKDFRYVMAKYVRAKHVQTDEHWMRSEIVFNEVSK